jgi:ABC-type sugar transport system substrate-binding protein
VGLELDVVAIVLLAGVSIFGGKGSIIGVVLAVLAFAGLQSALLLTNFNQEAIAALDTLGETGTETSGTAATPASQIPAIQAAISKGANVLIVSATDPTALCPTLNAAMKRGITVITYDSDAPTCRDMFIN